MAHWYLKSMQVMARLRDAFQKANTIEEIDSVLADIVAHGPLSGDRANVLPEMQIPVPAGPVEHW
jgi:hypothetical protein